MKLLDRYLIREILPPFAFGVLAFVLLFVSANILFKLTELITELGISLWTASELFLLWLPRWVVYTFPLATLVAILITFGRLSGDSELVAMHAGGIGFRRLLAPVLVVGLVVSLVTLALNEFVAPACNSRADRIEAQASIRAGKGSQESVYLKVMSGSQVSRLVYADRLDLKTEEMSNPYITWFEKGRPAMVTVAQRGRWRGKNWEMLDGVTWMLQSGWSSTVAFKSWTAELSTSPRMMAQQARNPSEMTYRQLREYIQSLRGAGAQPAPTRALELTLYQKFSIPFASLVFALIAPPLGIRSHRGSSAIGMGVAILIGFAYYVVSNYLAVMAQQGALSPLWAAWLPDLATGLIGVGLILGVRK
jgi:lipopolysaccharide export system permease protein